MHKLILYFLTNVQKLLINFLNFILYPRALRTAPREAEAKTLPKEDTTPPVIKINFADVLSISSLKN